jgi:VIT1/CCC1 family predicted Fe2+/Mn2+ transporter
LPTAIVLSAAALFGIGAILSLFSGRSAVRGGFRMLAIGTAAGAATWAIGSWIGVGIA